MILPAINYNWFEFTHDISNTVWAVCIELTYVSIDIKHALCEHDLIIVIKLEKINCKPKSKIMHYKSPILLYDS